MSDGASLRHPMLDTQHIKQARALLKAAGVLDFELDYAIERAVQRLPLRPVLDEHLALLRAGAKPDDPRRLELEAQIRELSRTCSLPLTEEERRNAQEWFGSEEER